MHLFHLDVSPLLNDAPKKRLRCNTKTTDDFKSLQRSMRKFASLLTSNLREGNRFID